MVAHADDLMLRLNAENCEAWKAGLHAHTDVLHDKLVPFTDFFARLSALFEVESVTSPREAA